MRFRLYLLLSVVAIFSSSCWDSDNMENLFTLNEEMLGAYLKNPERSALYSEFALVLDTTNVMGYLNTYGEYTCFAPTNKAMKLFYEDTGVDSYKELSLDTLRKFVFNHIIENFAIESSTFIVGRLSALNMANRYLSTNPTIDENGLPVIFVNGESRILNRDIEVHNGVIHSIDHVIIPTDSTLVERIVADKKFSLFSKALLATKLDKKLTLIEDYNYDPDGDPSLNPVLSIGIMEEIPQFKKYGYTILAESDSIYALNEVYNFDDLVALAIELYPEGANIDDFTNEENSLNQFVAYHLIDKQIGYNKFIKDYDTRHMFKSHDMYEYLQPMLKNSLIEVKIDRTLNEYNLFNAIPLTDEEDGQYSSVIHIVEGNYDNDALNGVYHEIDNILVNSSEVISEIRSKRLRIDMASLFPEIQNNNMRGTGVEQIFLIPRDYVEGVTYSENTNMIYLNSNVMFEDYQGDELIFGGGGGREVMYDVTIDIMPIPEGTYEIRFGYQPTEGRGVAQIYWDGQPTDIPLDLRVDADDPSIGHVVPGDNPDDPDGFENDKMMHNRRFMKGPACYKAPDSPWYTASNARSSTKSLRKVVGLFTFDEMKEHTLTLKAVQQGEIMLDYIEIVPIEVLGREDIY